jgi:hypothetical protein
MPPHDWFILATTAVILAGLPFPFVARRRALSEHVLWPDRQLNPSELEYLKAWRTRSVVGFVAVLVGWLLWSALVALVFGDSSEAAWLWGISMIGIAVVAVVPSTRPVVLAAITDLASVEVGPA